MDTSYGYPLLRVTDMTGNIEWYYPECPTEFAPIQPRLVKGIPVSHYKDGWIVKTFTPTDNPIPPIVLSVQKV